MEKNDLLENDFLKELMQKTRLESPSEGFVDRIMVQIEEVPEVQTVKAPFYLSLKSAVPYVLLALFLIFVLATSDLPIFNWVPGKDYLLNSLMTYMGTFFAVLKNAFSSKYVSWVLLISFSAGMLYFIDRLFSRRTSAT